MERLFQTTVMSLAHLKLIDCLTQKFERSEKRVLRQEKKTERRRSEIVFQESF